ncbi:efflux pump [Rhizodiscina lignyota]|uniref:Efflux pump n=1 Tax=Rhizodiscina lignyota TaxID=1504668 RepID=A0A9P4MDP5_9PEZI|nr:efflux pump [Rhizodiscina lignyota]
MEKDTAHDEGTEVAAEIDANTSNEASDKETSNEEAPQNESPQYVTGIKLWTLLASITLIVFLVMLDMSIIAIPRITNQFHSLQDVGWYGSAYLLASCSLQPLTGKIYSLFSTKITYMAFLALFEVGSALCGAAQSSKMLIVGRAVAGLGVAGLSNGAMTIISASAPLHKRPALIGIMMSISQLGIIGGPLIGGALTQYASWRWCTVGFFINLPVGAVSSIILILIKFPDDAAKAARRVKLADFDFPGFVLFAGFAIMFLLALEWGGTVYPWKSAIIIGLFCGSGGVLAIFAAWEIRVGDNAMIPPGMVRKRVVWSACLVIAFFFGALLCFTYYLPIYFQAVKGVSPSLSGVYVLPGILSQILMATVSGVLVGVWGYYLPWSIASSILVSISAGLLSTLAPHTSTAEWVIYQMIGGFGRGAGLQMPIVAVQNNLPREQNAVGMALIMFCQTFGGSLFLSFAQTIFDHSLIASLHKYAPAVNSEAGVSAGATAFRGIVNDADLPGVLRAYSVAIDHNFYLAAGASVGAFVCCWGMGWKKITKEKPKKSNAFNA